MNTRAQILAAFYGRKVARALIYGPREPFRPRSTELRPPRRLDFVGPQDYSSTGREFLSHLVEVGGLRPDQDVLDIGCGIGRMAIPLAGFLDSGSRYQGFDVVPEGIQWCQRNISARWPNFQFRLADVNNPRYNPRGRQLSEEFSFPYPDQSFDFAFATSVFTHLQLPAIQRYLEETARVLRPGGRLFATFFLLTEGVREQLRTGESEQSFYHEGAGSLSISKVTPESGIAFDKDLVMTMIRSAGLHAAPPEQGFWPGSEENRRSYQDIVVADRR